MKIDPVLLTVTVIYPSILFYYYPLDVLSWNDLIPRNHLLVLNKLSKRKAKYYNLYDLINFHSRLFMIGLNFLLGWYEW